MEYVLLILGFVLLVKCADIFVDGSSNLAKVLGIPPLIIGLTVVAFGTSAPEAAVSITASLSGQNEIAVGNVVGSNICNLLLVLGVSALFNPLKSKREIIVKDYVFSLLSYLVLFFMVADSFYNGNNISHITRSEGFVLLCFLGVYVYSLILGVASRDREKQEKKKFEFKDIFYVVIGLVGIIFGGDLVVDSSVEIATNLGISSQLIALTIVAIGTSLPELVTSLVASRKGETDIAIGNVIGSNIFNIFFILGLSSVVQPLLLNLNAFYDIIIMCFVGIIVYLFAIKNRRIGNKKGIIMLILYAIYIFYIAVR